MPELAPYDPSQPLEGAAPEKPAFDPTQPFEAAEKPPFDPTQPFSEATETSPTLQPTNSPFLDLRDKLTAGIGAELYTAPQQGAQFLDFVRTMFYKPVDMVLGTKISDGYAGRMAEREKEINTERGYAQEATGTGQLAQLATGMTQQLVQLPVQMASGGAGLAVKGIKGAIAASAAFGGLQSAENTFATNVEKRVAAGENIHDAANAEIIPSLTSGAITAAVTRGFGATGIESIFKATGAKGVVNKFATVLKEAGMEVAEEVTDETSQIMNDLIDGQKMTPQQAFDRIKQTVFLSAVMGGTATAVHQFAEPAEKVAEKAIVSNLEATGSPETAKVVQSEAEREDAIQRRAGALRAALNPELRQQNAAAGAQENFVEGTFPEDKPATPADIRLTTNQTPSGDYTHKLAIAPDTTVEQLQEWEKKLDLGHLPIEAQAEIKNQVAAEIKQRANPAEASREKRMEGELERFNAGPLGPTQPGEPEFTPQGNSGRFEADFPTAEAAGDWLAKNKANVQNSTVMTSEGKTKVIIRPKVAPETAARRADVEQPKIIPAPDEAAPAPQTSGEHIVSTAIQTPDGLLTGSKWNEPHEGIGIRHGLDEVPQGQRGFIVQDAEGNQRFVGGSTEERTKAGKIAVAARQTTGNGDNLQSSNLTNVAIPTAADGDRIPTEIAASRADENPAEPAPTGPLEDAAFTIKRESPLTKPAGRQPTQREVAVSGLVPKTPEEKAARIEQGRTEQTQVAMESGLLPTDAELHSATANKTEASKLGKELKQRLATDFPPEMLPEGATETTDKNKLTGDQLPSVIEEGGKVRPKFTNDPEITAQQLDLGQRVVLPEDFPSNKVNPAMVVTIDPATGERYVLKTDVKLPNGEVVTIKGPDEFTTAYKDAIKFQKEQGAQAMLRLDPETLQGVKDKVDQELKAKGIDYEPLEFDLEENPGNVDEPDATTASSVSGGDPQVAPDDITTTLISNYEALHRLGVNKPSMHADPIRVALKQISTDSRLSPANRKLAKALLNSKVDWTKVIFRLINSPSTEAAGIYQAFSVADKGRIDLNVSARHRGGIATTLLHEAVHHMTLRKVSPDYKRTAFEQKAYDNIKKHYDKALAFAYEKENGKKGSREELEKFARAQLGDKRVKGEAKIEYYGLGNLKEFVAETLSSTHFQSFLKGIEGEGKVKGKVGNMLNAVRDWLKKLGAGEDVPKGSLLDNAFDESFKLLRDLQETARIGEGRPQPSSKPGKMNRAELEEEYTRKFGSDGPDLMMFSTQELRDAVEKPVQVDTGGQAKAVDVNEDGFLGPDGKFYPAPISDGGHYSASTHIINNNPKLQEEFRKSGKGKNEDSLGAIYEFMEKKGYIRVVSQGGQPGTTTYITGKPTNSQKRALIDAAKERKLNLVWDNASFPASANGTVLYSPNDAFSAGDTSPRPQLTHEIGPDGVVVHGITIPDEASIDGLKESLIQIDKSNIPPVDKARLTADVNGVIETRESQENPVSIIDEDPNKFTQWINNTAKRIASSMKAEGNLPMDVFRRWLDREGEVKATSRDIAYTTRDFYKALREVYKINKADQFFKGFSEIPTGDIEQMNQALLGKVPMDQLPEPLRGPLTEMRTQIDKLSKMLIDQGLAADDLAVKVAENLGTYLTRSYRIFDDPKWTNKIPPDVRTRAKAFLLSELWKDNPDATTEDAQRQMDAMLEDWRIQGDSRFDRAKGKLGSQDFSTFIKRKDIAPELRALMGEYTDPVTNYARSITKMTNLIASNRFLKDVREKGMGKWLYEDGTQPPGFTAQIAAEANAPMAPLNGLRTRPEIAEAFKEFGKAAEPGGWLFRHAMKVAAIAKGSKTVGSLMTQARNAEQFWFFGMNGHYNMAPLKEALASTGADIGITDSPKWRQFYKNMLAMNVVDQSAKAGELRDVMNDAAIGGISRLSEPTKASALKNTAANTYNATIGAAVRMYQISDDVGKVVGFMNERQRQAKIMGLTLQDPTDPNWKPNAADIKASQVISLTYPTYSMVPKWIQQTRRQPVFGPFMTFSYEAMRTTYHNLSITADYLREAAKPGANPEYAKAAAQRLGGQIAVLGGLTHLVSLATRGLLGLTADEEEDARKFLPEWDRNSQLAFVGKDKGQLEYVNLSYQNPYSYITDPVLAVTRMLGERGDVTSAVIEGAKEFLQPFSNEGVLAGAIFDIARNKTGTGKKVYNEADTPDQKIRAILGRLFESVEPGSLTRLHKRFIPAAKGETRGNLKLDLKQELLSEVTGFKRQTLDYKQGLGFKASDFADNDRNSENIFRNVALREGSVTPEEIASAYERAETQRFNIWRDLHEIATAAVRRGLTTNEVRTILKARRVSASDANDIIRGKYRPFKPTAAMKTQLRVILKRQLPPLVSPYANKRLSGSREQQSKIAPTVENLVR